MEIFKLFGSIFVDTDAADNSMQKTEKNAESIASKLGKGIKTAAKWGAAIVTGATAAGTALVGFATQSASTADNIDKMSQKIGVSREAYQELDFICSQSGTSVNNLQAGMKTLVSAMDGAASGTASNIEQFSRLGISVTDTNGNLRNSEDVMWEVMEALQSMDNETEKARLATELFGKSGTELMPLLNGASGSIEEMRKQAHDLGLVLDDELIDNGVNLTDSLDQTKRAFASIATQLGGSLMPIVEQASDYIQQALPSIQALIQRLTPVITSLLEGILPPLMELGERIFPILFDLLEQLIPPVTQIIEAILPVIVQLLEMLLPPIVQIVQMVLPVLVQLITALLPLLQPILQLLEPMIDLLMAILQPLVELLNMILPPLIEVITAVVNVIAGVLQPAIEILAKIITTVLNVAFNSIIVVVQSVIAFITGHWQEAKEILCGIFNAIGSAVVATWEAIKNFLTGVMSTIGEAITAAWEAIKAVITSALDAIWSVITTVWDGIKDTITGILDNIHQAFADAWEGIKSFVSDAVDGIKSAISSGMEGVFNIIQNVLGKIPGIFTNAFDGVKNIVSKAIDGIKNFFDFDWKLPKIKLPHFSVDWDSSGVLGTLATKIGLPGLPKLDVEWYKSGGIMMEPTAFGVNPSSGKMMAGGEAGPEAIAPIDLLKEYISEAIEERDGQLYGVLSSMLDLLREYLPKYGNMQIVLDTGGLVGRMAQPLNEELGWIKHKRERGN